MYKAERAPFKCSGFANFMRDIECEMRFDFDGCRPRRKFCVGCTQSTCQTCIMFCDVRITFRYILEWSWESLVWYPEIDCELFEIVCRTFVDGIHNLTQATGWKFLQILKQFLNIFSPYISSTSAYLNFNFLCCH